MIIYLWKGGGRIGILPVEGRGRRGTVGSLRRSNRRLLDKVVLHITLKIEVGKLIVGTNGKELGETAVGVDDAAILLVLKTLLTDVGVNLLADLRASHLGSSGLAKELGELITDASGLDEPRRSTVGGNLPLLGGLLGTLELTSNGLLKRLKITLHGRKEAGHLLELGTELLKLGRR